MWSGPGEEVAVSILDRNRTVGQLVDGLSEALRTLAGKGHLR